MYFAQKREQYIQWYIVFSYSGSPGMCTDCFFLSTVMSPSCETGNIRNSQPSPATFSIFSSCGLLLPVGWPGWMWEPPHRLCTSLKRSFMSLGLVRLPRYFFTDQSRWANHGSVLYLRHQKWTKGNKHGKWQSFGTVTVAQVEHVSWITYIVTYWGLQIHFINWDQ